MERRGFAALSVAAARLGEVDATRAAARTTIHKLRYEDFVADRDGTTQRLCAATGIVWLTAMRDFAATARCRRVKRASAAQVRRHCSTAAVGGGAT